MRGDDVGHATAERHRPPPDDARCFGRFFYPPLKGIKLDDQCVTCSRRNEAIMDTIMTRPRPSAGTVLPVIQGSVCLVRVGDWGW
jgi:hypothetical protein